MEPNKPTEDELTTLDKVNLGFGVLAILFLVGSLALSYLPATVTNGKVPEALPNQLRMAGMAFMALYAVTLAYLKRKDLGLAAQTKQAKGGANIGLQIAAVIGILAAVNYFGARHHNRVDLTENKAYSLSEQTRKIVANLKEPVNVTLFAKTGDTYSDNLKHLWKEYTYYGDKIHLDIVDVDKDPTKARLNKITAYGSSMLERGTRKTTITGSQEQDLTSALLKVTQDSQKIIYFLVGHGEMQYDKFDKEGLSNAKDALEKQNYKLDQLALFNTGKVPSDAAVVVIAGPKTPLQDKEIAALEDYIDNHNGRVYLSLQPQVDAKVGDFAKKYGIVIHDDLVLDPKLNFFGDLAAPAVQKFNFHTTTSGLQAAYFPGARSLDKLEPAPKDVNTTVLVESSSNAWGETDLKSRPVKFDEGKDTKGPVKLVMLSEKGKGRLVVAGNTYFFSNQAYQNFNNGDLFLNAVNWMADEENLVSIPPKDNAPKSVNLLPEQYTTIFYGTVLGIPLALLLCAAGVWWRRR
jgi:ABC-type uncharacterized transport system involved in gliding motility auxiliary subunit